MAKAKTTSDPVTEGTTNSDVAAQLAESFKKEGAKRVNPDIFFHKFEDKDGNINPIRGVVLERRTRKSGEPYYIFGLTGACKLWDGDGNLVEGKKGMFAWVDERWCIQSLQSYMPVVAKGNDGMSAIASLNEVLIIPRSKRKLDGGKSLWQAEVLARSMNPTADIPLIAPKSTQPPPQLPASEKDDIPF